MDNAALRPAPPVLGTAESAALAFVNIMAAATEIREEQLAYWLDAYYQLRRAYEREAEIEAADDTVIRRSDLEPIMRELWQETLKKSRVKAAEQRLPRRPRRSRPRRSRRHRRRKSR